MTCFRCAGDRLDARTAASTCSTRDLGLQHYSKLLEGIPSYRVDLTS